MTATTSIPRRARGIRQGPLPYKWMALITTSSGTLFATVTMGIVNIALPSIAQSFNASLATAQWVLTIYPLVTVSTMLALGYVSDLVGRKRIYILGVITFAIGSLLCGFAQDTLQLIALRAVQSLGASMIVANSTAIVADAFPAHERGKSMGMISTAAALGLALGPGLGGLIVDSAGWRWAFFLTVPLALVTTVLSLVYLRDLRDRPRGDRRFDFAGAVLLSLSAASFLLALSEGQENGWVRPPVFAFAGVFLACVVLFTKVELRVALPTVDLRLIAQRVLAVAVTTGLIANTAMFVVMFLMPFYLIRTAGYSESEAGVLLTAVPLAMGVASFVAGWLCDRVGPRWLCPGGLALCAISFVALSSLGQRATFAEAGAPMLCLGLGLAMFFTPNMSTIMGFVPASRLGMASAVVGTVRHIGAAIGIAVSGAIFSFRLAAYTPATSTSGTTLFDPVASVGAFRDTYLVAAGLCVIGVLACFASHEKSTQSAARTS